ncbi:energy-coupling factor ABC transporter ATP-binding protein [Gandjariella thermophila]|uniref:ABC transporter ATP-binding protein n=1 Tax=Gandjariella thermophila TaxID=1931992 RepID=A0A4D4J7X8_9PSEU|nr:ABC transporter ATP-binding protein [Gandjariella thermophila]GDY32885.1 ABC transporter ATP-binding protein [Gandjariella thermophila]
MIELDDFSYAYPTGSRPALRSLRLAVPAGQLCGVVGPSGAGKSTFAHALAGFIPHALGGETAGRVVVGGRTVADTPLPDLVRDVGLVLQNPFNQISGVKFTVREELAFGLENLGVPQEEMVRRVDAVLAELRIEGLADRSPYQLSGGQQQLVALGSVLVMRPSVLVLDEPTSQLDPVGSGQVFDAVRALHRAGVTIVLVEHKLERLAEIADRVLVLRHGEVALDGPPATVLADPRLADWGVAGTRYTAAARLARERGLWPEDRDLPVTLDAAVAGFRAVTGGVESR